MNKTAKAVKTILIPALVIAALCTALMLLVNRQKMLEGIELKTLDLRFVLRGERKFPNKAAANSVKVIGIDAKTVQDVGRWPWPRGVLAKLFYGVCGEAQAENPDEGWEDTNEGWEDTPVTNKDAGGETAATGSSGDGWEGVPESEKTPAGDTATGNQPATPAAGTQKTKNEFGKQRVLGIDVLFDREERSYAKNLLRDSTMMNPKDMDAMATDALTACPSVVNISLMKFPQGDASGDANMGLGDESKIFKTSDGTVIYNMPLKSYQLQNSSIGYANMLTSSYDERVRKAKLWYKLGGKYEFSFALMSAAAFLGVDKKDIKAGKGFVKLGKLTIPVDDNGEIYINYRGKEYKPDKTGWVSKDNVLSAKDIMETPEFIPFTMQGNYIFLIGVTDPEVRDVFFTPYALFPSMFPNLNLVSGIELHKEIIDTILQGVYLKDAPAWALIIALLLGAVFVSVCTFMRLWAGIIGLFAFGAGYVWFASASFSGAGIIYTITPVLLGLPLSLLASMLYRNLVVDREKNAVKNIFKSYVAPHVLAELMEDPSDLKLGGKKSKVSVLFSDIRGFTTISEQLPPEILIKGLNLYLSEMTELVLNNSGMIDKFIGDAVMAIWGAPVPRDNDAANAVAAALRMETVLAEINPKIKELTGMTFAIGVGINTGVATLGNIGSENKLDYTVIGDTVNLASRLEGLTKQYGAFLVISEFTYAEIKDTFDCRQLDDVKVKGKDKPVEIYQVFCEKGRMEEKKRAWLDAYNAALALYKTRKFEEAKAAFAKTVDIEHEDKTAKMYIERCDYYIAEPPPADWDGSFAWKTK